MGRGRHLYATKPRRTKRVVGLVLIVAVVGIGIAAVVRLEPSWLGLGAAPTPTAAPTTGAPGCPTARLAGTTGLGAVAWVRDGALRLEDLDTCEERVVVQEGASPPVRFSHDGRWIGFGEGSIVSADGGQTQSPLGEVSTWQWSPRTDVLAGVTPGGGLVLGGPTAARRVLLPDGTGAGHVAFGPDGRSLAVDVGGDRVEVLDVADGATSTVYRVTPGTDAPPTVVGWSPDGRWVLFFSSFPGKAGVPLNAAPTVGGAWANVFDPVLPYADFLTWCGKDLVLSGGADRSVSEGNQLLGSAPPRWRFVNLSGDFTRSWIWPACSPNGRWVVAAAMPNRRERPAGHGARSLWLLSADGARRARLTDATDTAYEAPRWSVDGRFVLVVRRGVEASAPGALVLLRIEPDPGRARRVPGVVARLGPVPGERGHLDWSAVSDWYRPG
ncbi:MAG TPA: hypothetical protein VF984_08440 [Actinomycetota bacterium]